VLNNNQEFNSGLPPVTKVVLLITIGVFLLQMVSKTILPIDITGLLALNLDSVLHGQIWRFVTYIFLHGNFWHIFINMFMLVMFGAEMERVLGVKRFILLYFVSGILGD
jgi:membrane associated rhomboid family serine protease